MYFIHIRCKTGEPPQLQKLLSILTKMNCQVYKPRSWSHSCPFEGAMYVKGGSLIDLMKGFVGYEASHDSLELDCQMVLQKLTSEDARIDLENIQQCDLRAPQRHSAIRIQYGDGRCANLAVEVVCLINQERLVDMACYLVGWIRAQAKYRRYNISVKKLQVPPSRVLMYFTFYGDFIDFEFIVRFNQIKFLVEDSTMI